MLPVQHSLWLEKDLEIADATYPLLPLPPLSDPSRLRHKASDVHLTVPRADFAVAETALVIATVEGTMKGEERLVVRQDAVVVAVAPIVRLKEVERQVVAPAERVAVGTAETIGHGWYGMCHLLQRQM